MPAGVIIPFAGSSIPAGYLLCNGAVVSRTTYANLFKVIGTTYGAGDGSTTFNLPDLRDRFLEGAGTNAIGRYLSAGLPNISGSVCIGKVDAQSSIFANSGAFLPVAQLGGLGSATNFVSMTEIKDAGIQLQAVASNSIYSKSVTVQPVALSIQYLIKY